MRLEYRIGSRSMHIFIWNNIQFQVRLRTDNGDFISIIWIDSNFYRIKELLHLDLYIRNNNIDRTSWGKFDQHQ